MSDDTKHDKPVEKIDVHPVHAAIWRNSGQNGIYYCVTFEKRYKDKQGNWQGTQSFSADDLLPLAKAADRAHDRILELQKDKSWARTVDTAKSAEQPLDLQKMMYREPWRNREE